MGRWSSSLGLPLLTMELLQKSAKRRTWVIRVVFVLALLWFLLVECRRFWNESVLATLGSGGPMMAEIMGFLFCGVYLIVPLSSFALITSEKERDSLQLLLITRLGPWTIVLEKLLSQMVPTWLFLSTSLPLLAVAYSIGGVSPSMLGCAIWTLSLTALHCGCVALMCSAWSRTSVQAFVLTLVVGFAMTLGPAWFLFITGLSRRVGTDVGFFLCGPYLFFSHGRTGFTDCLTASVPLTITSLACLALSRVLLTRRAVVRQSSMARAKRKLSNWAPVRIFNQTVIGKLRLNCPLPTQEPVAWRETRQVATFWRFGLPAVAVPLFLVVGTICVARHDATDFLTTCHAILWLVAVLTICAKAAGLIATERTRQTLDVLLTTPTTGREIVRQKMRSVYVLAVFFLLLFALVATLQSVVSIGNWGPNGGQPVLLAFLAAIVTPAVYLPMFGWLSLTIGMNEKTAARATIKSVLAVMLWCVMPFFLCALVSAPGDDKLVVLIGTILTPMLFAILSIISPFESHPLEGGFVAALAWNTGFYAILLSVTRKLCLQRADDVFGAESQSPKGDSLFNEFR